MKPDPRLIPIEKAQIFNYAGSDVDAGTSILATVGDGAITPSMAPSLFRIFVVLGTAAKFKAQVTNPLGGTTKDIIFNTDTNLTANCSYMFDMLVTENDVVDFEQDQANNTIPVLIVQEIPSSL